MTAMPPLLEPEDLLALPDSKGYELLDGVPVEKSVGKMSSRLAVNLITVLNAFVRRHKLSEVFESEMGYRCFPNHPRTLLKPDITFIRASRLDSEDHGYFELAPDLAIEVISPGNYYLEIEKKIAEYRSAGVPLIWIVTPETRTILIRRLDGTADEVGENGELSGEDVIPEFAVKVAELFD
jgi:Uma2 family endonuclease